MGDGEAKLVRYTTVRSRSCVVDRNRLRDFIAGHPDDRCTTTPTATIRTAGTTTPSSGQGLRFPWCERSSAGPFSQRHYTSRQRMSSSVRSTLLRQRR